MNLTPSQAQIASDRHRFRVINAGRRFGKTILSIEELLGKAVAKSGRKVAYIAPTFTQARDIAWKDLKSRALPITVNKNEQRLDIEVQTQDGGTSNIILRGWEAVESLRGQSFDLVIIDEVAMVRNFWENWLEVIMPTLTDTRGEAMFISTPKGFNHFYDLYNQEDENYASFHFTTYDNPHIAEDEVEGLKQSTTEDAFAQEYLADFRKQEGLVYKEFSRALHVYSEMRKGNITETILGIDFGYTNPAAVLLIEKNFDNTYFVTAEWYKSGKTDAEIAEYAASFRANAVYPDPENPGGIKELQNRRLNCREVKKGQGSVVEGIQRVRELLKQRRLYIHESCVNLINELETYHYPDKKNDSNEPEVPVKENDHALDALRYVVLMNDGKQKSYSDQLRVLQARKRNTANHAV